MQQFEVLKEIYDKVFCDLNGYGVSFLEKENSQDDYFKKDVIYGQTPFELLYALFYLNPLNSYLPKAKVFYDLGSGIGNNVIGAYLLHNFDKCVGVELLDSLYELSCKARNKMIDIDKNCSNKIKFIHDNILNVDFSDADVIFFSCPTKNDDLRYKMEEKFAKDLKSGTIILSLIHKFKDEKNFKIVDARMVNSAWGQAPMIFYEKI